MEWCHIIYSARRATLTILRPKAGAAAATTYLICSRCGGLLTPERTRALIALIQKISAPCRSNSTPPATTAWAVKLSEAVKLGVNILHTAIPPLATAHRAVDLQPGRQRQSACTRSSIPPSTVASHFAFTPTRRPPRRRPGIDQAQSSPPGAGWNDSNLRFICDSSDGRPPPPCWRAARGERISAIRSW